MGSETRTLLILCRRPWHGQRSCIYPMACCSGQIDGRGSRRARQSRFRNRKGTSPHNQDNANLLGTSPPGGSCQGRNVRLTQSHHTCPQTRMSGYHGYVVVDNWQGSPSFKHAACACITAANRLQASCPAVLQLTVVYYSNHGTTKHNQLHKPIQYIISPPYHA